MALLLNEILSYIISSILLNWIAKVQLFFENKKNRSYDRHYAAMELTALAKRDFCLTA